MALLKQRKLESHLDDQSETRLIGRIDGHSYLEHSQEPAVQLLIADARRAWRDSYGVDPASKRVKKST